MEEQIKAVNLLSRVPRFEGGLIEPRGNFHNKVKVNDDNEEGKPSASLLWESEIMLASDFHKFFITTTAQARRHQSSTLARVQMALNPFTLGL